MRYQYRTTMDLLLALSIGTGLGWVVSGALGGIIGGLAGEAVAVTYKVIGPYLSPRSEENVKEDDAYSLNP